MANVTETETFDAGVYELATSDPVVGGAAGVSNTPHKNLANRTKYLKAHVDALEVSNSGKAPIASPAFTGNPTVPTPPLGDNDLSIPTTDFVQATVGGRLAKSVAGGANVTLTAIEAGNGILEFTGVLTASISVIVPVSPTRPWIVFNSTTGAFTLTVKTPAGTGVLVTQGKRSLVYGDGTSVVRANQDILADILLVDGAGSGIDADLLDGQHGAFYAAAIDLQKGTHNTAAAAGTADAITATYAPAIGALTNGLTLYVRPSGANTTTTPTFAPSALAAKSIVKGNNVALAVGDIAGAGHWLQLQYDLTIDKWVLLNPATGMATVTGANDATFVDNSVKPASTSWIRGAMAAISTAAGFVFSAGPNAYIKFPSWLGGWIVQWGQVGVTTTATVTLPIAFTTAIFNAYVTAYLNASENPSSTTMLLGVEVGSMTLTTIKINCNYSTARLAGWIAFGK